MFSTRTPAGTSPLALIGITKSAAVNPTTANTSFNPKQSFFATDPFARCPQKNLNPSLLRNSAISLQTITTSTTGQTWAHKPAISCRNLVLPPAINNEVENASIPSLNVRHVRRNKQGGFVDFHYLPLSRLSLDFGARAEANANFGTRVVPRVGASLALRYGMGFWEIRAIASSTDRASRNRVFDQLYDDQFGDFGNPSLKPEASKIGAPASSKSSQTTASNSPASTSQIVSTTSSALPSVLPCHRPLLRPPTRAASASRTHRPVLDISSTLIVPALAEQTSPLRPAHFTG